MSAFTYGITESHPASKAILASNGLIFFSGVIICSKKGFSIILSPLVVYLYLILYPELQGLVILDEKAYKGLEEWSDNETQSDTEIEGKSSDNNSGKSDSPELPEDLPQEDKDLPLLNF